MVDTFKDQVFPVSVLPSFLFQGGPQVNSSHNCKMAAAVPSVTSKHNIQRRIPWPSLVRGEKKPGHTSEVVFLFTTPRTFSHHFVDQNFTTNLPPEEMFLPLWVQSSQELSLGADSQKHMALWRRVDILKKTKTR